MQNKNRDLRFLVNLLCLIFSTSLESSSRIDTMKQAYVWYVLFTVLFRIDSKLIVFQLERLSTTDPRKS
jgi:hypothetical protein